MYKKLTATSTLIAVLGLGTSTFAYDFWGISVGKASHNGSTNTTFDGVGESGTQYVVGGWKYTRVDGNWSTASVAPMPGEGYRASRICDAQAIFFKADSAAANFIIIATSAQTGQGAPEIGYSKRLFGPGDLKLDVGGNSIGVGLRIDNLLWAETPSSKSSYYQAYDSNNHVIDMHARDRGTLGDVELNPTWAHVCNSELEPGSQRAAAFYVSGSGSLLGNVAVDYADTGVAYDGAHVYAYSVSVPWEMIGQSASNYSFETSWKPDCGNDFLEANFTGISSVPEPGSIVALVSGLIGLVGSKKHRRGFE